MLIYEMLIVCIINPFRNLPKSHDEWIQLLQKQESLHTIEVKKWQKILKTAVGLLKQVLF